MRPSSLRPISMMSIWVRLWSKWKLQLVRAEAEEQLDESLRGGITGRSLAPAALKMMLALERALEPGADRPLCIISLDASKCFDRILASRAFPLALRNGLPPAVLAGLGGFLLSVARRFSCSGVMSENIFLPGNGLMQGDPLSVLICNICVSDWTRFIKGGERGDRLDTCAFVDDRAIMTGDSGATHEAWARSMIWERQEGWVTNDDKTYVLTVGDWWEPVVNCPMLGK